MNVSEVEYLSNVLKGKRLNRPKINPDDFVSTGSTLLNLSLTGFPDGGFFKGGYFNIVGDSSSGKTFLSRTILAEAASNSRFDDYSLIYDDVERGSLMDDKKYFGENMAQRVTSPAVCEEGEPVYSQTVEDFYFAVDTHLKEGKPFIWVLDSMDCLSTDYEAGKFDEAKKAHESNREAKGSYGDGKAKINSTNLRALMPRLRKSGSILIVLSQTRDDIGNVSYIKTKTRAGGHALKFYAQAELWMSVKGSIEKERRKKKKKLGIYSKVRIKKNRTTGRDREIILPIFYSYGIDDTGSMVDFLIDEGFWNKNSKGIVEAKDFDIKDRRDSLIKRLEDSGEVDSLKQVVLEAWRESESDLDLERKPKYG